MGIRDERNIRVYNYTPNTVAVTFNKRGDGMLIHGCDIDGNPSCEPMDFEMIDYINSHSNVFKNGTLRFDESQEEELFSELHCLSWKESVVSENDIEDIVLRPNAKTIAMLASLRDHITMERIRQRLVQAMNNGASVSMSNVDLINLRYNEIRAGKILHSKLAEVSAEAVATPAPPVNNEINELKAQIAALTAMLTQQNAPVVSKSEEKQETAEESKPTQTAPKRGRPSSTKK